MHLHDVFGWPGPLTERQAAAWREWFLLDANRPNRLEHYVMQVAQEVRRQHGRSDDLNKFKIKFGIIRDMEPAATAPADDRPVWPGAPKPLTREQVQRMNRTMHVYKSVGRDQFKKLHDEGKI